MAGSVASLAMMAIASAKPASPGSRTWKIPEAKQRQSARSLLLRSLGRSCLNDCPHAAIAFALLPCQNIATACLAVAARSFLGETTSPQFSVRPPLPTIVIDSPQFNESFVRFLRHDHREPSLRPNISKPRRTDHGCQRTSTEPCIRIQSCGL